MDMRANIIKVLVVDDSALIRKMLTEMLGSDPEIEVVGAAHDPFHARDLIKQLNPDVLTLDVEMPRMDGYEFASHVRNDERYADVPIIMITSRVGDKHRARAIELGVNDYLGKPYQDAQLLEAIQRQLEDRGIQLQ